MGSLSSMAVMVFWIAWVIPGVVFLRWLHPRTEFESRAAVIPLFAPAIPNAIAQIANIGGWFWEPGFAAYLFGLIVFLYCAGLGFVLSVVIRPIAEDDSTT